MCKIEIKCCCGTECKLETDGDEELAVIGFLMEHARCCIQHRRNREVPDAMVQADKQISAEKWCIGPIPGWNIGPIPEDRDGHTILVMLDSDAVCAAGMEYYSHPVAAVKRLHTLRDTLRQQKLDPTWVRCWQDLNAL